MVIVLLVGSHVDHLVRDARILGICLVDLAIGRLDKPVFIDPRIRCKRVDQTDVRSFWCLDRAHPAVVRIVHVPHLTSRTIPGKTAGSQRGETPLVCQLSERIVLIHEL